MDCALATDVNPASVGYLTSSGGARILDLETGEELGAGQVGEIYLFGDTVSAGYYGRPDLTEAAFSVVEEGTASANAATRPTTRAILTSRGACSASDGSTSK